MSIERDIRETAQRMHRLVAQYMITSSTGAGLDTKHMGLWMHISGSATGGYALTNSVYIDGQAYSGDDACDAIDEGIRAVSRIKSRAQLLIKQSDLIIDKPTGVSVEAVLIDDLE